MDAGLNLERFNESWTGQYHYVSKMLGFVGIVVYYRIFILDFAIIAAPIFALFRKGKVFIWMGECQLAMDTLKVKITEAPVLISLDFSISALLIVLHIDASTTIG